MKQHNYLFCMAAYEFNEIEYSCLILRKINAGNTICSPPLLSPFLFACSTFYQNMPNLLKQFRCFYA